MRLVAIDGASVSPATDEAVMHAADLARHAIVDVIDRLAALGHDDAEAAAIGAVWASHELAARLGFPDGATFAWLRNAIGTMERHRKPASTTMEAKMNDRAVAQRRELEACRARSTGDRGELSAS